jgi:hypothetical protein
MPDAKGSRNVVPWSFHSLLILMRFVSKPRYREWIVNGSAVSLRPHANETRMPDAKGSRNVVPWSFHSLLILMRFVSKPRYRE